LIPAFPQGVPEQRFQGPGAAGRDNHPIEPFFRIMSVISLAELVAHENSCSWAWTTLGRVSAYSTVEGTSTTLPIFVPQ
jgi:hypothetical protein